MEHPYLKYRPIVSKDVILDLGATGGDFAQEMIGEIQSKEAIVYCVEPEKHNFDALQALCAQHPHNLIPVHGCSGDKDGEVELIATDQALLHHPVTTPEQKWTYQVTGRYKVPCYSMKKLVEMAGGHINFVKCDIEGGEIDTFLQDDSWVKDVDYLAIAAYHVVAGIRTHYMMKPWFQKHGFEVIVEDDPTKDDRDMLYARRVM